MKGKLYVLDKINAILKNINKIQKSHLKCNKYNSNTKDNREKD